MNYILNNTTIRWKKLRWCYYSKCNLIILENASLWCFIIIFIIFIGFRYKLPFEAWLHIYTDGSKLDINGAAGVRIICEHFSRYILSGTDKTLFVDEVEEIMIAFTDLNICPSPSE